MGEGVVQDNTDNWCGKTSKGDWTAYAGNMGGETFHQLTIKEMPSHRHDFENVGRVLYWDAGLTGIGSLNGGNVVQYSWGSVTANTGGNAPHNNMPPYLVVYIWKRIS